MVPYPPLVALTKLEMESHTTKTPPRRPVVPVSPVPPIPAAPPIPAEPPVPAFPRAPPCPAFPPGIAALCDGGFAFPPAGAWISVEGLWSPNTI